MKTKFLSTWSKDSPRKNSTQKLAKKLVPFNTELGDYLKENGGPISKSRVFREQLDPNVTVISKDCQSALKKLPSELHRDSLKFVGNNNFNMLVHTKKADITVQGCSMNRAQAGAIDDLYDSGSARYLPVRYSTPIVRNHDEWFDIKAFKNSIELNPGTTSDDFQSMIYVNCIESFPKNLPDEINHLHQTNANIYETTADFASQMSGILSNLDSNGIIWTDVKPGNILLRANGELAIADMKGFYDIDTACLIYRKGGVICWEILPNTTKSYLSDGGVTERLTKFKSPDIMTELDDPAIAARKYFINEWAKEHNFQFGVLLYSFMVNKVDNDLLGADPTSNAISFDYTLDVFKTPEGKIYKQVIQDLTHQDPSKRMHYSEATSILQKCAGMAFLDKQDYNQSSKIMSQMGMSTKKTNKSTKLAQEEDSEFNVPEIDSVQLAKPTGKVNESIAANLGLFGQKKQNSASVEPVKTETLDGIKIK